MRIIRHPRKKKLKGSVVALGTFDGVHRGHQKILEKTVKYAKKIGVASLAITFDPHPQQLIVPERGLKLLTNLREREALFSQFGVDGVVVINFNRRLQKLSDEEFVKKYLVDKLGVCRVYVGYDYAFGRNRKGNAQHLKALGHKYNFEVFVIQPVSTGHHIIKSRIIREFLGKGYFSEALRLLGHPYQIGGKVVKGSGRGKSLGFPTANLKIDPHKLIPAHGVYAGRVNGKKCVVNIGARPTFGTDQTVVEAHILNFRQNIRGKTLKVSLNRRLRDELQFSDVKRLQAQIRLDVARVKRL